MHVWMFTWTLHNMQTNSHSFVQLKKSEFIMDFVWCTENQMFGRGEKGPRVYLGGLFTIWHLPDKMPTYQILVAIKALPIPNCTVLLKYSRQHTPLQLRGSDMFKSLHTTAKLFRDNPKISIHSAMLSSSHLTPTIFVSWIAYRRFNKKI